MSRRELYVLGKSWYHDYSTLGFRTPQKGGAFGPNQRCKQEPLFRLIDAAIQRCRRAGIGTSGVEFFCADGFYANYAALHGADAMLGVDLSETHLERARLAAKLLGLADRTHFVRGDVFETEGEFDLAICAGGLYHLEAPARLLRKLARQVRSTLVIQTVYSLTRSEPDYFESPAPGWTWGCRFSRDYFCGMLADTSWKLLELETNELEGNERGEDRGSIYALCEPASSSRA